MSGKIAGIYVEIKGDASHLKKELTAARGLVTQQAQGMSNALNNALSPAQIKKSINDLVTSLNSLSNASKLTGEEFKSIGADLKNVAHLVGIPEKEFAKLQSRMMEVSAAKAQEKALQSIAQAAGLTDVEIKKLGAQMGVSEASIAKLVTPVKVVVQELSQMQRVINKTAASFSALSTGGGLGGISAPLADLVAKSRMSESELAKLQARLVSVQSAKAQEQAIRAIGAASGMTADQMAALGHKMGVSASVMRSLVESARPAATAISAAQVSVNQLAASLNSLHGGKVGLGGVTNSLASLAASTGLSGAELAKLQNRMLQTSAAQAQERALRDVARAANLTESEVRKLGAQMGVSAASMDRVLGVSAASVVTKMEGATVATKGAGGGMAMLAGGAKTVAAAFGVLSGVMITQQIIEFGKAVIDAGIAIDSLNRSYAAIFGGTQQAAREFEFVRKTALDTGQSFYTIADSYKQISASAKDTVLEGEPARQLFLAMAQAGSVLGLSNERMALSFKAFSDMMSKGTVQMEELKNQLGDNLPGALNIAAKGLGVTRAEVLALAKDGKLMASEVIPAMTQELQRMYAVASNDAALNSARAAVNRLSDSWTDLKANLFDSDAFVVATNSLRAMIDVMNTAISPDTRKGALQGKDRLASRDLAMLQEELQQFPVGSESWNKVSAQIAAVETRLAGVRKELTEMANPLPADSWPSRDKGAMFADERSAGALDAMDKGRQKMLEYIQTAKEKAAVERDTHLEFARTQEERNAILKKYADTVASIDKKAAGRGTSAAETAMSKMQSEIAKLSMSAADFELYQIDQEFAKIAKEIGAANPLLKQWVDLRRQEAEVIRGKSVDKELEDFFGPIDKESEKVSDKAEKEREKNLELITEFADKYKETVLGETAFKMAQIDAQAAAYLKAGSDEVAIAQWVAQEKLAISREWQDGATRALQAYADEAGNAALAVESVMGTAFQSMEDFIVQFVKTGKFEFADLVTSINAEIARLAFKSLAGESYSFLGDLLKTGLSAAGSYFTGGSSLNPSVAPSGASGLFYSAGHHSGGIAGSEPTFMRAVDPAIFSTARKYHTGGLIGDEVPIIAKRGEGVFTEGQMRALGGGGGNSEMTGLLRELVAVSRAQKAQKNVFAFDKRTVANELSGAEGEQMTLTHVRRNQRAFRAALGLN